MNKLQTLIKEFLSSNPIIFTPSELTSVKSLIEASELSLRVHPRTHTAVLLTKNNLKSNGWKALYEFLEDRLLERLKPHCFGDIETFELSLHLKAVQVSLSGVDFNYPDYIHQPTYSNKTEETTIKVRFN